MVSGRLKLLIVVALLMVLVPGVLGDYTENFQDYEAQDWFLPAVGWYSLDSTSTKESVSLFLDSSTYAYWDVDYPTNYYAFSTVGRAYGAGGLFYVELMKSDKSSLGNFDLTSYGTQGQWEIIRDPATGITNVWFNGVNTAIPTATFLTAPSYIKFHTYAPAGYYKLNIDNFHAGSADPKYWASTIPPNWSVVKDFINPANSGLYATNPAGTPNLIRTNYMYSNWSRGNGTTISTVSLKNVATGISYETLGVGLAGNWSNTTCNNLSVLIDPAATAPFGLYEITIDGGSGLDNHAYFMLTGNGASVLWDRDIYSQDDVATITYTITPAYWDTATYYYYLRVLDQSLVTKYNTAITSSSGSQTLTLDSSYTDNGVYYATVYAVKKNDSTEIMMNYDYMEMNYDTVFTGTCYNATNGTAMSGVNVSAMQGALRTFDSSDPTYRLAGLSSVTSTYLNASMNGFQNFTFLFTPLSAKTYNIDIPLVPNASTLTYTVGEASIGGLIYSTPYHQPISGATVHIVNATMDTTNTTTPLGYYLFDHLLPNGTYWIKPEKSGYAVGSNVSIIAQVS